MALSSLSKLHHLLQHFPAPLRNMLTLLATIFTLRNVLILFCLLNVKNLPLAWELRLIYRSWRAWMSKRDVARILQKASSALPGEQLRASSHPLFAPYTISSRTPLLEIDHNIHKSNSTYFSDLDESRTALVIRLLSSTKFSPAELESEGFKGPFAVILGAVHTSFLREIKAYEPYQVRSRVLGWDEKWILIGSVFVRKENKSDRIRAKKDRARKAKLLNRSEEEIEREEAEKNKGGKEVLLATCLSKYVVKKGRYTVPPERCWRSAGWLPDRLIRSPVIDSSAMPTPDSEGANGEVKITEGDLKRKAQETAAKAAEKLKSNAKSIEVQEHIKRENEQCWREAAKWEWDDVEKERAKGMEIAESWLGLDKSLRELWWEDFERGIVTGSSTGGNSK